jgi:hypothetical protein
LSGGIRQALTEEEILVITKTIEHYEQTWDLPPNSSGVPTDPLSMRILEAKTILGDDAPAYLVLEHYSWCQRNNINPPAKNASIHMAFPAARTNGKSDLMRLDLDRAKKSIDKVSSAKGKPQLEQSKDGRLTYGWAVPPWGGPRVQECVHTDGTTVYQDDALNRRWGKRIQALLAKEDFAGLQHMRPDSELSHEQKQALDAPENSSLEI